MVVKEAKMEYGAQIEYCAQAECGKGGDGHRHRRHLYIEVGNRSKLFLIER